MVMAALTVRQHRAASLTLRNRVSLNLRATQSELRYRHVNCSATAGFLPRDLKLSAFYKLGLHLIGRLEEEVVVDGSTMRRASWLP